MHIAEYSGETWKYSVNTLPFSIFRQILVMEALRVEWRSSTPRSLPEQGNDNIKYLSTRFGIVPTTCRDYSRTYPCATAIFKIKITELPEILFNKS